MENKIESTSQNMISDSQHSLYDVLFIFKYLNRYKS